MSAPRRAPRRRVDGVLLLDKPLGQSSNHALQAVRRLFNAEKAGHTGTLDPLATGLLPVCFGEATKFSSQLLDADKRYIATVQLGVTTDTADAEGVVLQQRHVSTTVAAIEAAMRGFVGPIAQIPPMHSALKRDGKPLYEYARAGIEIERPPREVVIHALQLQAYEGDRFVCEVHCSKGTYVRTLAADIGEVLGCGAHLAALRRTCIDRLDVTGAHTLKTLEELSPADRDRLLQPLDTLLADFPAVTADVADSARIRQGQAVRWSGEAGTCYRVYGADHEFIGVCRLQHDGWLQPQRLVASR